MADQPEDALTRLQKSKANRFRVLNYVYESSGGSTFEYVNAHHIMSTLESDKQQFSHIVAYLISERLITATLGGWNVKMTHRGLTQVEAALETPKRPTRYFPPANTITIHGDATISQIQQGTSGSTQAAGFGSTDLDAIRAFMTDLQTHLDSVDLPDAKRDELRVDLSSVEGQLESPNPKWPIVAALLGSVRTILENASGEVAADYLKALDSLLF